MLPPDWLFTLLFGPAALVVGGYVLKPAVRIVGLYSLFLTRLKESRWLRPLIPEKEWKEPALVQMARLTGNCRLPLARFFPTLPSRPITQFCRRSHFCSCM